LEFSMLVGHYVMARMMLGVAGARIEPAFELDGTFAGRTLRKEIARLGSDNDGVARYAGTSTHGSGAR
jgi:hypothetical protein